jgi:DNA-directed RNA polymerase subunit RPC12/RpoP
MPQRTITTTVNICCRCLHEWPQRLAADQKPVRCPKCRSPYWDRERLTPKREKTS